MNFNLPSLQCSPLLLRSIVHMTTLAQLFHLSAPIGVELATPGLFAGGWKTEMEAFSCSIMNVGLENDIEIH